MERVRSLNDCLDNIEAFTREVRQLALSTPGGPDDPDDGNSES